MVSGQELEEEREAARVERETAVEREREVCALRGCYYYLKGLLLIP